MAITGNSHDTSLGNVSDQTRSGDIGSLDVFVWRELNTPIAALRKSVRLFAFIFGIGFVISFALYVSASPKYTAVAMIGPPSPSPTSAMLTAVGGGANASVARRLLGGSGGSASDSFDQFLLLLPSTRLCDALIKNQNLLPKIFYKQWNPATKTWNKPGFLRKITTPIKKLIHRPVYDKPGVDTLSVFLDNNLSVRKSGPSVASMVPTSGFSEVSFEFDDREQAESILNTILKETDNLIREDQRRDVLARISFIKRELNRADIGVDERAAMISILSAQEQLLTVLQADNRYASTLIIPPYASLKPSSPPAPFSVLVATLLGSMAVWILLILASSRLPWLSEFIKRFEPREN